MSEILIIFTTLLSGALVIYHHVGYPLVLQWVQRRSTRQDLKTVPRKYASTEDDAVLPTISIVIPAYKRTLDSRQDT